VKYLQLLLTIASLNELRTQLFGVLGQCIRVRIDSLWTDPCESCIWLVPYSFHYHLDQTTF